LLREPLFGLHAVINFLGEHVPSCFEDGSVRSERSEEGYA
jgi:hypothetical protein